MAWLDQLIQGVGVLLAALTGAGGFVKKKEREIYSDIDDVEGMADRSLAMAERNDRRLTGDDDDPHAKGVLEISRENGEKIDKLDDRMEEQHDELLSRMNEIADG